jgi:hypothetical protein
LGKKWLKRSIFMVESVTIPRLAQMEVAVHP